MHHLLSGVGGSCESTEKVNGVARRDSSISLEESAYKRDNPEPSRNTLAPLESQKIEDRHDPNAGHGCTLPIPSPSSSPSVVAPIDVYLRCDESQSLEARLIRLDAILSQGRQTFEPENISLPPEASSWDIVNTPQTLEQKVPSTPVLQPTQHPKATDHQPTTTYPDVEMGYKISVDSKTVSDLLLSDDLQPASDHTEEHKETLIKYENSAKRSRRKDRARIHKGVKKRNDKKKVAKSKSV
ncbi:hypothetical protein FMUND_10058 [Fusarium mundagurra]|uniref:Uncharacterized protein n=1 Tax=Fusarium mundagurra TaxID=1567541 RepID=A0A8H5YBN9_9HYPO|nr:hypothetical protein FMUND_10058 [Fusarium mundagurra]